MTNIETPKHDLGESAVASAQTAEYLVDGMTCSHCVASVTEEISSLSGVEGVTVQLKPGGSSTVSVASSAALDRDAIRIAIEEAGYSLAGDLR